jgi:uncharacterized protein YecE (DUF72 family)
MDTYIGTCSWADVGLVKAGAFYPRGMSAADRLTYYAALFPTVEVDTSYYAIPTPDVTQGWAQRTPSRFKMHVKAFRLHTLHWTEPKVFPPELRARLPHKPRLYLKDLDETLAADTMTAFRQALRPLAAANKLGLIIFQFPAWVLPSDEHYNHILAMQAALAPYRLAIEFRNALWLVEERREKRLQWLRDHNLTLVCVDEPQGFASSVPPLAVATTDVAYVRFHGRNGAKWEAKVRSSAERFDWDYRPSELQEWLPKVRELQEQTRELHLLMNTNNATQGPRNAILLGRMLGEGMGEETAVTAAERALGLA